jgi:hypothetical protein
MNCSRAEGRGFISKIIVVRDNIKPWRNDRGISILGIRDFLLDADSSLTGETEIKLR